MDEAGTWKSYASLKCSLIQTLDALPFLQTWCRSLEGVAATCEQSSLHG